MGAIFKEYQEQYKKAMEHVLLENMVPEEVWIARAYSQEHDLRPWHEDFAERVISLSEEDPELCASVLDGIRMLIDEADKILDFENQHRLLESIYGVDEEGE